jgi:hypothetical protein
MKWLQWLIDNPMMVVVIGGVLLQMLKAIFGKKGAGDSVEEGEAKEVVVADPDLAERTRKIREEIQRKIEARARGEVSTAGGGTPTRPSAVAVEVARNDRISARRDAEILEEQAALVEKLREAELMKASARRRVEFEQSTADHTGDDRVKSRQAVLEDLRSPAALRRAFVLREVLGPPVALRR